MSTSISDLEVLTDKLQLLGMAPGPQKSYIVF